MVPSCFLRQPRSGLPGASAPSRVARFACGRPRGMFLESAMTTAIAKARQRRIGQWVCQYLDQPPGASATVSDLAKAGGFDMVDVQAALEDLVEAGEIVQEDGVHGLAPTE